MVPAMALLIGASLLMGGVIAWRLGYIVKIEVTRQPRVAARTSSSTATTPRKERVVHAMSARLAVNVADAAAVDQVPPAPAPATAPSRALAAAPAKAAASECPPAGSYVADASAADIVAAGAMPERLTYFKRVNAAAPDRDCRVPPLAANARR